MQRPRCIPRGRAAVPACYACNREGMNPQLGPAVTSIRWRGRSPSAAGRNLLRSAFAGVAFPAATVHEDAPVAFPRTGTVTLQAPTAVGCTGDLVHLCRHDRHPRDRVVEHSEHGPAAVSRALPHSPSPRRRARQGMAHRRLLGLPRGGGSVALRWVARRRERRTGRRAPGVRHRSSSPPRPCCVLSGRGSRGAGSVASPMSRR